MITGNGRLMLRSGSELAVSYQFSSDYDDRRAGYLFCDLAEVDPGAFCSRLELTCEDGSVIVLAVMNFSEKHLGVVGRVLCSSDAETYAEASQMASSAS